jgi:hypothetical protein
MIARLEFRDGDATVFMILDDRGEWTGPEPWRTPLNQLAREEDTSPAAGRPYHAHVLRMAEQLGATVTFERKPEMPPDTVY